MRIPLLFLIPLQVLLLFSTASHADDCLIYRLIYDTNQKKYIEEKKECTNCYYDIIPIENNKEESKITYLAFFRSDCEFSESDIHFVEFLPKSVPETIFDDKPYDKDNFWSLFDTLHEALGVKHTGPDCWVDATVYMIQKELGYIGLKPSDAALVIIASQRLSHKLSKAYLLKTPDERIDYLRKYLIDHENKYYTPSDLTKIVQTVYRFTFAKIASLEPYYIDPDLLEFEEFKRLNP
ncbi:MAG: hypothetical protein JW765_13360 [Deltaproteobacteria bacterium]|nr:hypothetical protein [Candidatus Zymogenaceae bacterium]